MEHYRFVDHHPAHALTTLEQEVSSLGQRVEFSPELYPAMTGATEVQVRRESDTPSTFQLPGCVPVGQCVVTGNCSNGGQWEHFVT